MSHERKFVLRDDNLEKVAQGKPGSWGYKNLGKSVCMQAESHQEFTLNPGKPPGGTVGILYGTMFDAIKDGWCVTKIMEAQEISPVHQQYYQITTKQKEDLEGKIKQGLAGIGQSVADLELVEHDVRKYEDYAKDLREAKSKDKEERKRAQMRLKSVFVDEVDHHTGGSREGNPGRLSMAFLRNSNIMPTIVDDFMEMESAEDVKKKERLKNLPTVEKRVLEVKYKAYEDWLKVLESTIKNRLERMHQLKRSREKTLDEYREWLKPYIVRHKFIEEMLQHDSLRKGFTTHILRSQGNAVSFGEAKIWFWKPLFMAEDRPIQAEIVAKDDRLKPMDEWAEQNLIFNFKSGLIADFPWITKDWVEEYVDNKKGVVKGTGPAKITKADPYYNFLLMTYEKALIRFPSGEEEEDGEFKCSNFVMSMNIMAAKVLEQKATEQDMENYVDDVLGLPKAGRSCAEGKTIVGYNKQFGKYRLDKDFLAARHHGYDEWHPALKDVKWEKLMEGYEDHAHGHDDHGPKHGGGHGSEEKPKWVSKKEFMAAFGDKAKEKFYFVEQPMEMSKETKEKLALLGFAEVPEMHFFRPAGPYENTFKERITKFYFKWADAKRDSILKSIEKRMNIAGTKAGGHH